MATEVQLWWGSLFDADRRLLPLLSAVEQERVASLDRPADRGRSLVGAALLRTVVSHELRCAPDQVRIDRTCAECGEPHGRPRVVGPLQADEQRPPEVSVSHSGHLIGVALCRTHQVGLDVQRAVDLPPGTDGWDWVSGEARLKLGAHAEPVSIVSVQPPLPGYRAALSVLSPSRPTVVEQQWRSAPWRAT
ncbi:4'-phosphopantetheinyl transferase family protein [Ornithinimicrobium cavernae]|uniref:4'-phosphopantetheinyl transferase family protein n=1 Tax=Ornithinimicrobium cavernae TaxID=2666047 RepID=UPI000D69ED2D|nr:hypothetical protein [Ornithinimicrobium cavernae]